MIQSRRCGYTLIEYLITLGIVAFLAALVWPIFTHETVNRDRGNCQRNLKQLGLAFQQYAQDYDEKFVPVSNASMHAYGWAEALQPYLESPWFLQCPSEATTEMSANPVEKEFTDYWMNANLSRVRLDKISDSALTILSGDGNDGKDATNARYSLRTLPQNWLKDEESPAYRHLERMNILFADGHVKALDAKIVAGVPREHKNSFVPKWRP